MLWSGEGSAKDQASPVSLDGCAEAPRLFENQGYWAAMADSGAGEGQVCALKRALWLSDVGVWKGLGHIWTQGGTTHVEAGLRN